MEEQPPSSENASRRRWLRWVLWASLGTLILLGIFLRPLVFWGGRLAAIHYAAKENLALNLKLQGSLYENLVIEGLSVRATGPSSLQELTANSIELHYSLPDLIKKGRTEFLKSVSLRSAYLFLDPSKAPPPAQKAQQPSQTNLLNFIPKQVEIRGVTLIVRSPEHDLEVVDALLTLFPDRPGALGIEKLQFPNGRVVNNIAAATSYKDRNFLLTDLEIAPEIQVQKLNLDLSRIERGKAGLEMRASLFKGNANLSAILVHSAQDSMDAKLSATGISLDSAAHYLGIGQVGGTLGTLKARLVGNPNVPASWEGALSMEANELKQGSITIDQATTRIELGGRRARVIATEIRRGQSSVKLQGTATLPQTLNDLPNEASGQYSIQVPAVAEIVEEFGVKAPDIQAPVLSGTTQPPAPEPITGSLAGDGSFELKNSRLNTLLNLTGTGLAYGKNHCEDLRGQVRAAMTLPIPEGKPLINSIKADASVQLSILSSGEYQADQAVADLTLNGDIVEVNQAFLARAENRLSFSGTYQLPEDPKKAAEGKADLDLSAPNLRAFSPKLGGSVALKGQLQSSDKVIGGNFVLSGSSIRFEELVIKTLSGQVAVAGNEASVPSLRADFGSGDFANLSGQVSLSSSFPYQGQVEVKLRDLSVFQPLLRSAGHNEPIAGALNLNWTGKGERTTHSGEIKLDLRNGKFARFQSAEASITGTYSGESIQFPQVRVAANNASVECSIYYGKPKQPANSDFLGIQNLALRQGSLQVLFGNAFIPLDLGQLNNPPALIPANEAATVDLASQSLDLKKLFSAVGKTAPVAGSISAALRVRGNLGDLNAGLQIQGRNLKSPAAEKLGPAKLDFNLNLEHNRLALKSIITQEDIKPLVIAGELPFDVKQLIEQRRFNEDAPLKLSAKLENTPLGFLAKASPEIRFAQGQMSLEANAQGTIRQPILSGAARIDMPALRFSKATLPGIANFQGLLRFEKTQLTVERLRGEIGGGPFGVNGKIDFVKLTEPALDLHVQSRNLLVQRNNSVTVRANSDLRLQGPLQAGDVSGVIGITHSRFFREVDILPIGLPGRPTPSVPKVSPQLELPPQFKDWRFNLKIRTDDPFKVSSNLANGGANVDLLFAGTGAKPMLTGVVAIQNFVATLPFSKMNVDYGYVTFTETSGLNPKLDIHGTSELRDYHIDIYIQGTAQDPQTVMTSDPSLPQEDIVALLATGATVKEISGNPDVLAGRAAVLLFDKLYAKIFKKKAPLGDEPISSRFQVDLGGVSSSTGKQEVNAQFKVTDQFYLIGEIGLEGTVGGKIKYVMRFR